MGVIGPWRTQRNIRLSRGECLRSKIDKAFFETHLMVSNPMQWVEPMADSGVNQYTFHIEPCQETVLDVCRKVRESEMKLQKGYFPERPKRTHPRRRKRAASSRPGTALADAPPNMVDLEQAQSSGNQSAEEQPVVKLVKGDGGISLGVSDEHLAPERASSSQSSSLVQLGSQDLAPPEDADRESLSPRSELCFMCVDRPKDGAFIHSTSVHVLCCYQCALKVWNETKKCPMCKNTPHNVLKLVFG